MLSFLWSIILGSCGKLILIPMVLHLVTEADTRCPVEKEMWGGPGSLCVSRRLPASQGGDSRVSPKVGREKRGP